MKCAIVPALCAAMVLGVPAQAAEAVAPATNSTGTWAEITVGWGHRGAFALDRLTGNIFGTSWHERGTLMSTNFGATFTRVDSNCASGDSFSPYAIFAAADGSKLAVFSSQDNSRSGHSLDGGKTWTSWTKAGAHGLEYGVVDWASGAIFLMPHEEYRAYFSPDMGKSWTNLPSVNYPGGTNKSHPIGKRNYYQSGIGIFSATELVLSHDSASGIQRSEDCGRTWTRVADHFCQGPVQIFQGTGYWLAKKEDAGKWSGILLATKDRGKTWQPVGKPIENGDSPYMTVPRFGKDEKQILVAAAAGILESIDGGNTWNLAVKYPEAVAGKLNVSTVDTWDCFEYDPLHDVFYLYFFLEGPRTWVYRR